MYFKVYGYKKRVFKTMYTSKEMIVKLISCVVILQIMFNGCSACNAELQACIDNILSKERIGHTFGTPFYHGPLNTNLINDIANMRSLRCTIDTNPFYDQTMSDFDVSSIQDFSYCFSAYYPSKSDRQYVIHYDLNSWDVSKGTTFEGMFYKVNSGNTLEYYHYDSLTELDLLQVTNWNVSSGTDFDQMFYGGVFPSLNLNNWQISNTASVDAMLPKYSKKLTLSDLTTWFNGDELTQRRIFDQMPSDCENNFFRQDYDISTYPSSKTWSCYSMCAKQSTQYKPTRFSCPYPKLKSNTIFYGQSDDREAECCYNPCDDFDTASRLNGTRIEYKVGNDCHYADVSVIGVAKTMIDSGAIQLNGACQLQN